MRWRGGSTSPVKYFFSGAIPSFVDCWFETPEGITVVDFKTDFVQTEEDVAQHAELYRGQLAAYSLALERVLEKAVTRKALYFLQAGKTVEIS